MRYRTSLWATGVLLSVLTPATDAAIVAHYRFDESSGTTAADSVGSVTGAVQGSASFVTGGIAGNAISLSTTSDGVVNMGNNFGFTSGNFSISYWIKTTTVEADTVALSKHSAGFTNGYLLPVGPTGGGGAAGKSNFTASSSVANGVTSTTTVNDGNWHHIVATYTSGGNHSIFVDGTPAEQTKVTSAMIGSTSSFYVGGVGAIGNPTVADGRYTGLVDDLQMYNTALSNSEIDFLFANPGQPIPEPAGLGLVLAGGMLAMRRRRQG